MIYNQCVRKVIWQNWAAENTIINILCALLLLMAHIILSNYVSKCSHPLFKKKQTGHKKNDIHEEDANKKVPVTYDSVKNAVVGDSITKTKK